MTTPPSQESQAKAHELSLIFKAYGLRDAMRKSGGCGPLWSGWPCASPPSPAPDESSNAPVAMAEVGLKNSM